jgi:carboxyl-terminal processing protease
LLLISSAVLPVSGQTRERPGEPIEPFYLKPGSYFSATSSPSENGHPPDLRRGVSPIAAEVGEAYELIRKAHISAGKLPPQDVIQPAIEGMLSSLDPHSAFFNAKAWKELNDEHRSGYTGIGASIGSFEQDGDVQTYILSSFALSPAEKARLGFGDRIVSINGESMSGRPVSYVRDRLRGPEGTTIRLTVERNLTGQLESIPIRRVRVAQPSIPDAYILRPGIGYIELSNGFHYTTIREFDEAMINLKSQGMRALILDLRGNGGGIVDQAVRVVEKFVPAGTLILTQRGRSRLDGREWRSRNTMPETMPLVVLVDEETASASEIVAGALQDNDRALIVGEKTFGKGLVQSVIELPGKNGLALTTARYLTPSGRSIQREYRGVDSYDYFNNRNATAAAAQPYFEARTLTNRKVVGGDGIQPDEAAPSEKMSRDQAALLSPLFFFSRDLIAGRIAGYEGRRIAESQRKRRISRHDVTVDNDLAERFVEYFAGRNRTIPIERVRKQLDFIKQQIRLNLATAAYGQVTAAQVIIENDPQVAKAVALFPKAAQLARAGASAQADRR